MTPGSLFSIHVLLLAAEAACAAAVPGRSPASRHKEDAGGSVTLARSVTAAGSIAAGPGGHAAGHMARRQPISRAGEGAALLNDAEGNGHSHGHSAEERPNKECWDSPYGWEDSEGYPCSEYKAQEFCTSEGEYGSGWSILWGYFDDYAKWGETALMACCGCGGGTPKRPDWLPVKNDLKVRRAMEQDLELLVSKITEQGIAFIVLRMAIWGFCSVLLAVGISLVYICRLLKLPPLEAAKTRFVDAATDSRQTWRVLLTVIFASVAMCLALMGLGLIMAGKVNEQQRIMYLLFGADDMALGEQLWVAPAMERQQGLPANISMRMYNSQDAGKLEISKYDWSLSSGGEALATGKITDGFEVSPKEVFSVRTKVTSFSAQSLGLNLTHAKDGLFYLGLKKHLKGNFEEGSSFELTANFRLPMRAKELDLMQKTSRVGEKQANLTKAITRGLESIHSKKRVCIKEKNGKLELEYEGSVAGWDYHKLARYIFTFWLFMAGTFCGCSCASLCCRSRLADHVEDIDQDHLADEIAKAEGLTLKGVSEAKGVAAALKKEASRRSATKASTES